ncbi:MAG: ferritin-like domain-containing protein [Actinobacteria bacterium]|nr:ferritin-like domain-containing protein [Actinomycetota bacterium]
MTTHRYALPVEATQWHIPGHSEAVFNWEYDEGRDRLLNLYEKGKEKQWNANTRIDWSRDVDTSNTDMMPDEYVSIYGSPTWERLNRDEKDTVRHHMAAWMNSQFLHGEQGALICASKIVQTAPDIDSKFYAATQVMDEARHVEAYSRFLNEKIELAYPINPHLKTLLDQTITDDRWDMTYLGMQVMIEGVALAAFSMIRDFTKDPLGQSLNAYVMQDEARHVAFGSLALQDAYAELTEKERQEREEFVVEASYLLKDRFLAEEVWETLGFDVDECVEYVDNAQLMGEFRKALFSRVVPTVKRIGLWGPNVQKAFLDMGVLHFQDLDLEEFWQQDEDIAEEMERLLAEREGLAGNEDATVDSETRGEQLAATIVAGEAAEADEG